MGEFRQLRRAVRVVIFARRSMAKDIPHPAAEPISQIRNNFVRGVTRIARIVAVLDQRQFRLGISEDMIALKINRRIEPGWSRVRHDGFKACARAGVKALPARFLPRGYSLAGSAASRSKSRGSVIMARSPLGLRGHSSRGRSQ